MVMVTVTVNLARTDNGWTPLYIAAKEGHQKCVAMLIKAKADVNHTTISGYTPLMIAKRKGHVECARILRQKMKSVNQQSL
jgi:ankyrin repeat protein